MKRISIYGTLESEEQIENLEELKNILEKAGVQLIYTNGHQTTMSFSWSDYKVKEKQSRGAGKKARAIYLNGERLKISVVEDLLKEHKAKDVAAMVGLSRAAFYTRLNQAREAFKEDEYDAYF